MLPLSLEESQTCRLIIGGGLGEIITVAELLARRQIILWELGLNRCVIQKLTLSNVVEVVVRREHAIIIWRENRINLALILLAKRQKS